MTSYPCPVCLTEANLETGCPGCGRPPDPAAAEVIELDRTIADLAGKAEDARRAYTELATRLQVARERRSRLAARIWAEVAWARREAGVQVAAPVPTPTPAAAPVATVAAPAQREAAAAAYAARPAAGPWPPAAPAQARPEASTQAVKNILFVLGGILIGIAAIVFTVFAWETFGMAGKAAILAAITAIVLAVPLPVLRKRLRGTAETFAAIGLLFVLLDGYSVWRVNLGGVREAFTGWTFAGLVCAVTASVALAYAWLTTVVSPDTEEEPDGRGLAGPAVVGLVLAQPVLPLVFSDVIGGRTGGFALVFVLVAAADLAAVWGLRRSRPTVGRTFALLTVAWIGYALSLLAAHLFAFVRFFGADGAADLATPAVLLLLVGAVAAAAGPVARVRALTAAGVAWTVLLALAVVLRYALLLDRPNALVWTAAAVAVLAAAASAVYRPRTAVWIGAVIGIATGGAAAALVAIGGTARVALLSIVDEKTAVSGTYDWRLGAAVVLLTLAAILLLLRWSADAATAAAAVGVGLLALAAPGVPMWSEWTAPAADLAAAALLASGLIWAKGLATRIVSSFGAPALAVHALLVTIGSATAQAWTLTVVLIMLVAVAFLAHGRIPAAGATAVAACPPLLVLWAAATADAVGASDLDVLHIAALTALVLPAGAWAVRRVSAYARAAEISVWCTVVVTVYTAVIAEPYDTWAKALYPAFGLLAIAALAYVPTGVRQLDGWKIGGWAATVVALAMAKPPLQIFVESYTWLAEGWDGRPTGVGLTPGAQVTVGWGDVLAFAVLTLAVGIDWYAWTRSLRSSLVAAATIAPIPAILALVALDVRWPGVPLVMLVAGLARLVRTGLSARLRAVDGLIVAYAVIIAGSGLAGLSMTKWSSITGLALVTLAFVVLAVWGKVSAVRWTAWPFAGLAWTGLALTSAHAAELAPRPTGLVVLASAAVLLGVSMLPRLAESRALEPLAHLVAFTILIGAFAGPNPAIHAAKVFLGWGVVVGLSALARYRAAWQQEWIVRAAVAGGLEILALWCLLWATGVEAVEAYSLPVAGVALLVGFLALRRNPALTSWAGYGPALLAAFAPSLLAVLPVEGDPVRRLALGVGGLAVVIGGSVRRRQAPVVIGAVVLVVLAVHELTLYWTELPLWLPIGLGGAILLALAITYERRLRNLRTLRSKIASFT